MTTITNTPSPVSSDSFPNEEGLDDFNEDINPGQENQEDGVTGGKRKSRRPPSTAERRATHNAVERARRESLNGRFMDLASALPNMVNVKRPSKSVIVAKSLEFVQGAQSREQYLVGQNDALRQEINELRKRLSMQPVSNSPVMVQPVPMVNRNRKASSAGSSIGTADSPHLSTPSSLQSFDQPAPPQANFAFNPAYASAFPAGPTPTHAAQMAAMAAKENNATPVPSTAAPFGRAPPALDVQYLMALSMQQQQQQQHQHHQNMMHMQQMGHQQYQQVAPWMVPSSNAPVAAGGDNAWPF